MKADAIIIIMIIIIRPIIINIIILLLLLLLLLLICAITGRARHMRCRLEQARLLQTFGFSD